MGQFFGSVRDIPSGEVFLQTKNKSIFTEAFFIFDKPQEKTGLNRKRINLKPCYVFKPKREFYAALSTTINKDRRSSPCELVHTVEVKYSVGSAT